MSEEAVKPAEDFDSSLPVIGSDPHERADASRNRSKILSAAAELFAQRGAERVSMDDVAEAAGVGKGTLYRRFGDRAGLARAILQEHEVEFQESLIRGEPPLGPGAPPGERLVAFGRASIERLETDGDLILAAESGAAGARFQSLVYASHRAHVRSLLAEIDSSIDADYLADVLLAALSAEMVNYWRGDNGLDSARITDNYERLVRIVVAGCPGSD